MRIFLLPISTRRTLIYCQRLNVTTTSQQSWLDKGTIKAAKIWAGWEKKESGWKKKVVDCGNIALKRIPFEEWGLKSIPPLSARLEAEELSGKGNVEVHFPSKLLPEQTILGVLRKLGTERQSLHRKNMIWSFVAMPISAPIALIPIIPNLPFFYLVFRAWSHWRALSGSKHIEFLLKNHLITPRPSKVLDELYSTGKEPFDVGSDLEGAETLVLHRSNGTRIAEALEMPELDLELDRAVWQVEKALRSEKELQEERKESDKANSAPGQKKH
ncbi:mitochondrial K+-H+ exchange-related-domain-containing protein [Amylocarpus encephaloides]|uniref:Mitochondrial K+-H+ exchange-related-domain-containing protein n=1 Tax=Amylocarpus encephaloides TaxID=45428 RepID=A0A9P7YRY4_9HELO|nr:mitochondrial K+-H+ exchange-related-domain-containing protein [Amylocarpus encephaloides]